MKSSFTKQEIREVIQEIIGDFWNDLLYKTLHKTPIGKLKTKKRDTGKGLLKNKSKDDDGEDDSSKEESPFYMDVDKWVDDMTDLNTGKYIGPTLHGRNPEHHFFKGLTVRDPQEDITMYDIQKMMSWNEAYAHDSDINIKKVSAFNTKVWDHYRRHKQSKFLGSFPT